MRNKNTREYGVVIKRRRIFFKEVVDIQLTNSGKIIKVDNLSLWIKVLNY